MRNAWYVAAWSSELAKGPFARTLLGHSVLLMRLSDGSVAAIGNRCPHRFAPLERGTMVGDTIQCPYHGLRFDRTGACVHRPGAPEGTGLRAARVPAWPVVERHKLVWLWAGDAALADARQIPDLSCLDDDQHYANCLDNYLHSAADYLLTIDNLMDLSHVEFVHGSSLGSPGMSAARTQVREHPGRIEANRWMPGIAVPPAIGATMGYSGKVDHWLDMTWLAPSNLLLRVGVTAPGAGREQGREALSLHLLTPETERSCHYFWASSRDFDLDRPDLIESGRQRVTHAFVNEDKPLIEACQRLMGDADFWSLNPVLLACDGGGVLVRRALEKLVAAENQPQRPQA